MSAPAPGRPNLEEMVARIPSTKLLVATAMLGGLLVFGALIAWEHPGLGIGHFFYLSIVLVGIALGPVAGAVAGTIAAGLFSLGVYVNAALPTSELVTLATPIRLVTFVAVGTVVGWLFSRYRAALGELALLAERDSVTGLPNTRAFEQAISRRLEERAPFALLLGDINAFRFLDEGAGEVAEDALRRVADALGTLLRPGDELARVGAEEFAILTASSSMAEAAALVGRLERGLAEQNAPITFGWSSFPQEGNNALSLYRAADERLYARRLLRDPVDLPLSPTGR